MGATPPSKMDGSGNILRRKDPSLDAIRKQLLGRNASKSSRSASHHRPTALGSVAKQQQSSARRPIRQLTPEDDSESDGGRGAMFSSKKGCGSGSKKATTEELPVEPIDEEGAEDQIESAAPVEKEHTPAPTKRKATSYLDEILAEKGAKKKKRKKGKGGTDGSKVE